MAKRTEKIIDSLRGLRLRFRLAFGVLVVALAGLTISVKGLEGVALAAFACFAIYVLGVMVTGRMATLVEASSDMARTAEVTELAIRAATASN